MMSFRFAPALAAVALLASLVAVASSPELARAQANPSCGMLLAPACGGPFLTGTGTLASRLFGGSGCAGGCVVTATNAYDCAVSGAALLGGQFKASTDTVGMGCDFDCGARGKCSVRGGDGLPVELLAFGAD